MLFRRHAGWSASAPLLFLLLGSALPLRAATLLADWTFDNASAYSSPNLGSFNAAAASYGEAYSSGTKHLSGNTATGSVLGATAYIDFSGTTFAASTDINGGTTSVTSWGVFSDAAGINSIAGDNSAQDGSLMLLSASSDSFTIGGLSSQGYQSLTLSFAARKSLGASTTDTVYYSLDGGNSWISIGTVTPGNGSFSAVSLSLPSALDNQSSFSLMITSNFSSFTSSAFDNLQITGISAVPEPSSAALIGVGALLLAWSVSKRRREWYPPVIQARH